MTVKTEDKKEASKEKPPEKKKWTTRDYMAWPLDVIVDNSDLAFKYTSLALYLLEGILLGNVVAHSAVEPIPMWMRVVWHIVIAVIALIMGLLFAPYVDKFITFMKDGRKSYTHGQSFILSLAYLAYITITAFAALATPFLTFLMAASLTGVMANVMMAIRTVGLLDIPAWFTILQGHNTTVSTYLGTLIHYFVLLLIIIGELFKKIRPSKSSAAKKNDGKEEKERTKSKSKEDLKRQVKEGKVEDFDMAKPEIPKDVVFNEKVLDVTDRHIVKMFEQHIGFWKDAQNKDSSFKDKSPMEQAEAKARKLSEAIGMFFPDLNKKIDTEAIIEKGKEGVPESKKDDEVQGLRFVHKKFHKYIQSVEAWIRWYNSGGQYPEKTDPFDSIHSLLAVSFSTAVRTEDKKTPKDAPMIPGRELKGEIDKYRHAMAKWIEGNNDKK